MRQNIKELFEKDRLVNHTRRADHEDLFIERLYEELPIKSKSSFGVLKIAASIVVFVSLGLASYFFINQKEHLENSEMVLSTISPDIKEIENFYVDNINLTLSEIQQKNEDLSVVDRYMKRFSMLKEEHNSLLSEIQEEGPSSMSINALINNLKKQLELLKDLKIEMETLKTKDYETV